MSLKVSVLFLSPLLAGKMHFLLSHGLLQPATEGLQSLEQSQST